ncbi:MAG: hypothetical protein RLN83_10810 [Balneola sp.]
MSMVPECTPTIEELFEDGMIDEQELSQLQDDRKQKIRHELGRDYCPNMYNDELSMEEFIRTLEKSINKKDK